MRIYFVAWDGFVRGGQPVKANAEIMVSGVMTRNSEEVKAFLAERFHKEKPSAELNGVPRVSNFKWVGVVIFGKRLRWN